MNRKTKRGKKRDERWKKVDSDGEREQGKKREKQTESSRLRMI